MSVSRPSGFGKTGPIHDPCAADKTKAPIRHSRRLGRGGIAKYMDPITTQTNPITGSKKTLSRIILKKDIFGSGSGRDPPKEVPKHDIGHEQTRKHQPRENTCHKQFSDAFINGHAIDNQGQRWWDHQPKVAAPANANDHMFGISARPQFRDRHFPNHIQCGRRRTRNGRKNRASRDIGM